MRTIIGPEKTNSASSNTLTDFIDFKNFSLLFSKILSESVDVDGRTVKYDDQEDAHGLWYNHYAKYDVPIFIEYSVS